MATKAGETLPNCYTAKEAVERSRIRPDVFAWIVHTEKIQLPRIGNRSVYTDDTIRQVLAVFNRKDPHGRFLAHAERKNGPQKRKAAKQAVASEN